MDGLDFRVLTYIVWGLGTTLVYGIVFIRRAKVLDSRRDARARREFLAGFGLFLTAFCANLAILVVLFGDQGDNARAFFSALALGAFFAVGVVMLTDGSDGAHETNHER